MELFPLTTLWPCLGDPTVRKLLIKTLNTTLFYMSSSRLPALYPTIRITDHGIHPPTNTQLRLYDL